MRWNTVFFDLDGTLSDPAAGICGSVQYALEKGGYPVESIERYHSWIGPPLLGSFEEYLHCDRAESERLVALYRERFGTVGLFENKIYPGIPELLRELKERGGTLVLATGKPTVYARRILEHFGILDCFAFVSGIELSGEPLDKHGVITEGLRAIGGRALSDCVMVGDRLHDVEGAKKSGITSLMVLYGYGDAAEAAACGADMTAESVDALRERLLKD